MSELKLPRLLAAAKEFNVGRIPSWNFLSTKVLVATTSSQQQSLRKKCIVHCNREFQGDKVAKTKADQIEIPKGNNGKKKETRSFSGKKNIRKLKSNQKQCRRNSPARWSLSLKLNSRNQLKNHSRARNCKIEAPEIEGPKTLGKIDLSTIDSSTRPKKVLKQNRKNRKKNLCR